MLRVPLVGGEVPTPEEKGKKERKGCPGGIGLLSRGSSPVPAGGPAYVQHQGEQFTEASCEDGLFP